MITYRRSANRRTALSHHPLQGNSKEAARSQRGIRGEAARAARNSEGSRCKAVRKDQVSGREVASTPQGASEEDAG